MALLNTVKDFFDFKRYESPSAGRKTFQLPPSIVAKMRIKEYDANQELFFMTDAKTPVAMYEIKGFATEGATDDQFLRYEERMFQILNEFPRYLQKETPWTVQIYCKDETDLYPFYDQLKSKIKPSIVNTKLTQVFLQWMDTHCQFLSQVGGAFNDPATGHDFRGRRRVARLVFYRKGSKLPKQALIKETNDIRKKLETKLIAMRPYGVNFQRMNDKALYLWMFAKLHLNFGDYANPYDYLRKVPYVEASDERPYGYDFMEQAFNAPVESNEKQRHWQVGKTYHQYISALALRRAPIIGAVTAERQEGITSKAWFDSLPPGSEFHMTFMPLLEHDLRMELEKKTKSAKKSTATDAEMLLEEAAYFQKQIEQKNYLHPTQVGCFISAENKETLENNARMVRAELENLRFEVLDERYDLHQLDKWLRFLPGNYDPLFDRFYLSSRKVSVRHLARLCPLGYSRSGGTNNPLIIGYNRMAEPIGIDPFLDKQNNSHMLMIGTTGAGKSVAAGSAMFNLMAIHRPYLTIMDAGRSFEFLVEVLSVLDLSIHKIIIQNYTDRLPEVSLNPFAETGALIRQVNQMDAMRDLVAANTNERYNKMITEANQRVSDELASQTHSDKQLFDLDKEQEAQKIELGKVEEDLDQEDTHRDYLADFLLAGLLMVCGGRDPDEVGITQDHQADLMDAIVKTAKQVTAEGREQMVPGDLLDYLRSQRDKLENDESRHQRERSVRLEKLTSGLNNFLGQPLNAMYFNRPAEALPDVDITYFEMGIWKDDKESNIAPRTLAFVTMMNRIMAQSEARQKQDRFSVFFGDECHIVTTKKVTAASLTQCAKMSRKVGLSLWFATQNAKDFTGNAAKMLSAFEFWVCLDMSSQEFEQACQFINVTNEQRNLFNSINNEKGLYSEAVVLSKKFKLLLRNVPMREVLFLLANEQKEKNRRLTVAKENSCSEAEAALIQAQVARGDQIDLAKIRAQLGLKVEEVAGIEESSDV